MSTCVLRCYATSTVFILKLLDFFFFFTKGACSVILIMAISVNRCVEMGNPPKTNHFQRCNQLLQSMEEGHRKAKCVQL